MIFYFKTPSKAKAVDAPMREKILQMDLPAATLILGAVICYVLALQWGGQTKSWSNSDVIGCFVGFGVLLALFIATEVIQGERAMVVPRLMKDHTIIICMIFVFFVGGGFFALLYYLPIYFQVVDGVSASQSGVRNLPLILAVAISSIISGGTISATGHFVPILWFGGIIGTIGSGLIYTIDIGTPAGKWIGYQILTGVGLGLVFQIPIIVCQAIVAASDLSSVTAMVLCTSSFPIPFPFRFPHNPAHTHILTPIPVVQTIGGAFFVSAANTALTNILKHQIPKKVDGLTVADVLAIGVTQIRQQGWTPEQVLGIEKSYMSGLKAAFAISIASTGIATLSILGFGLKWRNLKAEMKVLMGGGAAV